MADIKKNIWVLTLFLIVSILVLGWFKDGYILGTAEAIIPFYNLERYKDKTAWTWTDFQLGTPASLTLASSPSWWLLAEIQKLGVSGFLLQAFTFWILFISAAVGVYALTKTLFPHLPQKYLILSVLFYWFNPLSMVNVWNRFLYNYMVFWAVIPILLFLLIKGLQSRLYIYGISIGLVSGLFSFAFTAYVFNLLTSALFMFTFLYFILVQRKKDFILFAFKFILLTLAFFILVNAWWILPAFHFINSENTFEELAVFSTFEGNLYTLNILSRKLGNLVDITRFMHFGFYNGEGPNWSLIYNSFLPSLILFTLTGIILWGIYKLRFKSSIVYLAVLFFLGIFIAKGNNQPFGEIFQFLFKKITFLQILRDPFEKISFVIALVSAPLFAASFFQLGNVRKRIFPVFFYVLLLIILGLLGYPFFSGLIFTSNSPPNNDYSIGFKVSVPSYYKDANDWLENQGRNFRFISFPLGSEGMTYKWDQGYQGVEASEIIFTAPNISFNTTIPYYYPLVEKLEELLFTNKNFYKAANALNARFILTRKDVDIKERRLRDPISVEDILGKNTKNIKKVAQFGNLTLWENTQWKDKTVYASTNLVSVSPHNKFSELLMNEIGEDAVSINEKNGVNFTNNQNLVIIYPNRIKENENRFNFILDKDEGYSLFIDGLRPKNIIDDSSPAEASILIDGKILNSKFLQEDGKLSYGLVSFGSGNHEIVIETPRPNLAVSDKELTLNNLNNQIKVPINNFEPYSKYELNFDYQIKSGEFVVVFEQSNDQIRNGQTLYEGKYYNVINRNENLNGFSSTSRIYIPQRSDSANLLFWVDPNNITEVVIKNIQVRKISEAYPVLIKSKKELPYSAPQISYIKHNPAKYSVSVKDAKGPFILVLSELFNAEWAAIFDDRIVSRKHFIANSYANGWLIEKTGDFNLNLVFIPERFLFIGKIISFLSFTGGLVYIIVRKFLWK